MSGSQSTLLDILEAEFSPPLDTSLIAAIVADYVSDSSPHASSSSSDEIQTLRAVFAELAAQAEQELLDEDALSEQFSNANISPNSITDETTDSHDFFSEYTLTSNTPTSSTSDSSSQHSFSSPLGFLQAAFPHIPNAKLRSALSVVGDSEDVDMASVVETLLTSEYVRELEERGLDALDDADIPADLSAQWQTVEGKKKKASGITPKSAKKNKRGTTIALADIRQQHHVRPTGTGTRAAAPDPWTQLSSVASYLATLIPTHSASYFQSVFHSPEHTTPAKALRAALSSISPDPDPDPAPGDSMMLFSMFEILSAGPTYVTLNSEERAQLLADAQLALRATHGRPDPALDIVTLLRELDTDSTSGEFAWGVYHNLAPVPASPTTPARVLRLPTGPPPVQPPPRTPSCSPVRSTFSRRASESPDAWKTVPQRPSPHGPHPLAEFIPAYSPAGARRARGAGNGLGKGGMGDVGELWRSSMDGGGGHVGRARALMDRRREALREAGRAWQKGSSKTRGGEVALFFAERARDLQQRARLEQLDAAREMVQAKRTTSANRDTVDLHGTTVVEAIQIVKDILNVERATPSKPLYIITGRGKHSVNGVGVLGPAVKSALADEGWTVGKWDGGLIVRGRAAWRT
ncbi:hypothetical protein B0H21DRAFT_747733 [Amylocystis lapponica]|nr:hypothetical protein B0H21DRAFT_747733 [Amylocystis lapponica]